MSQQPKKGHFFISSYDLTLEDAEFQFEEAINDKTINSGKWQLWRIVETEYGMNYVITFADKKKYRESDKVTYLELIKEIDTSVVQEKTEEKMNE